MEEERSHEQTEKASVQRETGGWSLQARRGKKPGALPERGREEP